MEKYIDGKIITNALPTPTTLSRRATFSSKRLRLVGFNVSDSAWKFSRDDGDLFNSERLREPDEWALGSSSIITIPVSESK